jgi:hypothetical protein
MSYFTAYMFLLAIVNFLFTCAYSTMGSHKMAIATGATTACCCLAALVWLTNFPS